jgi:hypothetical protein
MRDEMSLETSEEVMDEATGNGGQSSASDSSEPGTVYFLSLVDPTDPDRDFRLVKVGITTNDVEQRIQDLQTGNPYRIRCVAAFPTPVARQVEHWVHRANAARVAHLEWLRAARLEIPALVSSAQLEEKRLASIAAAKARWSHWISNNQERKAGTEDNRLHQAMQAIRSQSGPLELQLKHTTVRIALLAGRVWRIVRINVMPTSRRFDSRMALDKFSELAASHMVEKVRGGLYWRQMPNPRSAEWARLREEVGRLEQEKATLDRAMVENPDGIRDEGERTDELVQLHADYLELTQQKTRLELDEDDIRAQMIQQIEDFEAIAGVCSFRRSPRQILNADSFRKAHPIEAERCRFERSAYVGRTVYASRSY